MSRAFVVSGAGRFGLRTFPRPAIGPDEGLLEVVMAGVDGTDVRYLNGEVGERARVPFIAGDEIVGRVVELGERAAIRWGVTAGDLVAVDPHLACGRCRACRTGRTQFCAAGRGYGARVSCVESPHLWGAFAEHLFLPAEATVAPLGDLEPEVGVLVPSMLANGLRWVCDIGGARPGDGVVIVGAGQQALGCTVAAAEAGAAAVVVCGLAGDEPRLAAARALGATATLDASRTPLADAVAAADLVIDVTGSPQGLTAALGVVAPGGTVVVAGLSGASATLWPDRLVWNEVAVRGAYSHDAGAFFRAVDVARRRRDALRDVVSHRFRLADAAQAVRSLSRAPRPVKVVVDPQR